MAKNNIDIGSLPQEYRPISSWEYFLRNLLYSIPVIGWIIALITACSDKNIHAKNHAASYFVVLIFAVIVGIIGALASIVGLIGLESMM